MEGSGNYDLFLFLVVAVSLQGLYNKKKPEKHLLEYLYKSPPEISHQI